MEEVDVFTSKFHNLEGITLAERKRSLYNLFHLNSSLHQNKTLRDAISGRLSARTHLERIFLVEFLIYFRCSEQLLNEFLKGDDIVASKIAKQNWFFEESFQTIGPEFVHQVLPTLSYSVRLKILKKLVLLLSEEQSDKIFDAVLNRYGIYVATNILTSCSHPKIEDVLRNYPVLLWTSQLKLLYKKAPELIHVYLEERVKHEGNAKFLNGHPIIHFIATKNPTIFCELQEKYKFEYCKIGKHATKKIVKCQKDKIIAKPELYVKNLDPARLVRTLGQDFRRVFLELFPRKKNQAFFQWKLLQCYPKKHQFTLFKSTFDQIFYDGLDVSQNFINNHFLEMITEDEERERWARLKSEHDKSDRFLKYFKAQNCIKTVKGKFNMFSQVAKRIESVGIITESCLISKDWKGLLTVCEFLCGRLKNDDKSVHAKFLQVVTSVKYNFVFQHLDEAHWKYIKQIMIKADSFTPDVIFKYLEYVHLKAGLVENETIHLLQKTEWVQYLNNFQKSNKLILLTLLSLAPRILSENNTVEEADIRLILACKNYNLRFPKDEIVIFDHPRLIESLKNVLQDSAEVVTNSELASAVGYLICTKNRNEVTELLTRFYWNSFERLATIEAILWFLRFRPDLIMDNIEKFLSVTVSGQYCYHYWSLRDTKPLWHTIKCYSHLQMDRKCLEFCTNRLNDANFENKTDLIEPLSLVMSVEDFTKLVESYKPTTPKVDMLNKEEKDQFTFRRNLLKLFVKLNKPETIIPVVLEYLKGDYVASCISALHSCLYKIPENRLKVTLDKLCNTGAVSAKKHGYYFICITRDEATILSSLKSCHLSQSIAMAYQHFVKNPSEPSWDLLRNKLEKVDNNDHFTSLLLVNTPAPKKYKSVYFQTVFGILREKRNRFAQVLMDKVDEETIGELQTPFFSSIKDDFLNMKRSELVFGHYLLYCEGGEKFDVIFDALRNFKEKNWSFRAHESREKLHRFVGTLFTIYMDWSRTESSLVATFREGFQEIFAPVEAFEEFVTLSLMQFKNQDLAEFTKSVVDLNDSLVGSYGKLTVIIFAECLGKTLDRFFSTEGERFLFYLSLVEYGKMNCDVSLLVIHLMPKARPQLKESATYFYRVLDLLKQVQNETVRVHLHLYLKEQKV